MAPDAMNKFGQCAKLDGFSSSACSQIRGRTMFERVISDVVEALQRSLVAVLSRRLTEAFSKAGSTNAQIIESFAPSNRQTFESDKTPKNVDTNSANQSPLMAQLVRARMQVSEQDLARATHRAQSQIEFLEESLDQHAETLTGLRLTFTQACLRTDRADRHRVEGAIQAMYRLAELPQPQILWFESITELLFASIVMRHATRVTLTRDSTSAAAYYAPNAALFQNRFRAFKLFKEIPHRVRLVSTLYAIMEQRISAQQFTDCWHSISQALSAGAFVTGKELEDLYPHYPPTRAALNPSKLRHAVEYLERHLTIERDFQGIREILAEQSPWLGVNADDPRWIFENCFHAPFADAADVFRHEVFRLLGFEVEHEEDEVFMEVFQAGGWWVPFEGVCLVCDNPNALAVDAQMRLHNNTGVALQFHEDSPVWAVRGVVVPEFVIRKRVSLEDINRERNLEVRRIMIEAYGSERYINDSGARVVADDRWGTLYRKDFDDDESMTWVAVVNSTPEPDGSFKTYHLRVPPLIVSPKAAVAWTFGMNPHEYQPVVET